MSFPHKRAPSQTLYLRLRRMLKGVVHLLLSYVVGITKVYGQTFFSENDS
jgi:hypothetical protein